MSPLNHLGVVEGIQLHGLIEASYLETLLKASVWISREGPVRQIKVPRVTKVTYPGGFLHGESL